MSLGISNAVRNAAADAATGVFDGGTGRVNIYTGSKPATPATAATGTLLATLSLNSDAADPAVNGTADFNAITSDTTADASGTAGWFRIYNSDETAPGSAGGATDNRIDGTCSGPGGGGDLEFDDDAIVAGGTVAISSFSITVPAS